MKKETRPTNHGPADLMRFKWPPMAITSITHRISGVALFIAVGFGLYALDLSLSSPEGYAALVESLDSPFGMLVAFVCLAALGYHFVAGVKHFFMDNEVGESLEGGRFASKVTMLFGGIVIILAGIWVLV